jgi:flagellar protein FliS
MTASPMMLVAMLYDKAIASLSEAIRAVEAGDVQGRWKANHRAFEIVQHLQMTLDRERGGEIARNLDRLYGLILRLLPEVNARNDAAPARQAIALLEPLRDAWRMAARERGQALAKPAADEAGAGRTAFSA